MTGSGAGTILIGMLIMGALVYKAVDLVKYVSVLVARWGKRDEEDVTARSEAWSGILAIGLGAALGVGIVFLMDITTWTNEIKFGGLTLLTMPFWDKVVLGLVITSLASVLFDFKKAIDRTDSASTPKFFKNADDKRRERVAASLPSVGEKLDKVLEREDAIDKELKELIHQPQP